MLLVSMMMGVLLGYVGSIAAAGPLAATIVAAELEGDRRGVRLLALGGALAEALWAFAAARGLGYLLASQPKIAMILRITAIVLAIIAGALLLIAPDRPARASPRRRASALIAGFLLVALNPSFPLSWMTSVALLERNETLATALTPAGSILLATGAGAGVIGWYLTLSEVLVRHRERLARIRQWVVRGLGVLLIIAGVASAL